MVDFGADSAEVERINKDAGFLNTVTMVKLFVDEIVRKFWAHLPTMKIEEDSGGCVGSWS